MTLSRVISSADRLVAGPESVVRLGAVLFGTTCTVAVVSITQGVEWGLSGLVCWVALAFGVPRVYANHWSAHDTWWRATRWTACACVALAAVIGGLFLAGRAVLDVRAPLLMAGSGVVTLLVVDVVFLVRGTGRFPPAHDRTGQ